MTSSSLELALLRARYWLCSAVERRDRFVPPAGMRPDQALRMQSKLDTDIELARAQITALEDAAGALEANFGGVDL